MSGLNSILKKWSFLWNASYVGNNICHVSPASHREIFLQQISHPCGAPQKIFNREKFKRLHFWKILKKWNPKKKTFFKMYSEKKALLHQISALVKIFIQVKRANLPDNQSIVIVISYFKTRFEYCMPKFNFIYDISLAACDSL